MNKLLFFFLILSIGLTQVFSKPKPNPKDLKKTEIKKQIERDFLQGFVLDKVTKKGIKNATIEIKNINLGVGYYKIQTDENGFFKIKDFIRQVQYSMDITANGYVNHQSNTVSYSNDIKVYLDREGIVAGNVRDTNDKPIAGVEVKLSRVTSYSEDYDYGESSKAIYTKTDASGFYKFTKLYAGRVNLRFSKDGYIKETAKIKKIEAGERVRLPMALHKPASVNGFLLIKDLDTPATNITVTLVGKATHSAYTFPNGEFKLDDIKPGIYDLKFSHKGFIGFSKKSIKIAEGQSIKDLKFTIQPKNPSIVVTAHKYTFAPGGKIEFSLRTLRIEKYKVRIYQIPAISLIQIPSDLNKLNPQEKDFKVVNEWEESIKHFAPYNWMYQKLELKDAMATGAYCLEVSADNKIIERKVFSITSTGIVVKRSVNTILTYATSLVDNKPIAKAKVLVLRMKKPEPSQEKKNENPPKDTQGNENDVTIDIDVDSDYIPHDYTEDEDKNEFTLNQVQKWNVDIVHSGETNDQGLFIYSANSTEELVVLTIHEDGSYAICNTGTPYLAKGEKEKYYIYTDRPVYRSGDTIYFKILGKQMAEKFLPIQNRSYLYKIVDYQGSPIHSGDLTLNDWGIFHGEYISGKKAVSGKYYIQIQDLKKNALSEYPFYIEQYIKPEYKIEINTTQPSYTNGQTAEFKIEAKYFFGAPMKNANLSYKIYETKITDERESWWEQGEVYEYKRVKAEGEKYLDENGTTVIKMDCGVLPFDRRLMIEVSITDKSNVQISSSRSVYVGRGNFKIHIQSEKNFYSILEEKSFKIVSEDNNGKPLSKELIVNIYKYIWKPWERVYVHDAKPIYTTKIKTNEKGEYDLKIGDELKIPGEFDLEVTSTDDNRNIIKGSYLVWLYRDKNNVIPAKFKNIELAVEKSTMEGDGELTVLVKSRFMDNYVCLTLEGKDIYETRVVKMDGNVIPVKFQFKKEYSPNVYITATVQRNRNLFSTSAEVDFPYKDTKLKFDFTLDKKVYAPGEKANIKIKVTDENNQPVQADLSIGVVDESIYQIRADHTPHINPFFYTKISNWVSTVYSYPVTILAGAGKNTPNKDKSVRENFKDTAFWNATIKTNAQGIAEVLFELPDNLTTWRITTRAHDRDGRLGEDIDRFISTKDIIARIGKPRFFVEKDQINMIGIVNNNTKTGIESIQTRFLLGKKKINPEEKLKISLPGYGMSKTYYPITIPMNRSSVDVTYLAKSPNDRDGIQYTIPILKRGLTYKILGSGDLATHREIKITPINTESGLKYYPEELQIKLSPSPMEKFTESVRYMTDYSYSCTEQTISKYLSLIAYSALQESDSTLPNNSAHLDLINEGVRKIQQIQNSDGTWGWWYGGKGNEYLTGYALESLFIAQKNGVAISTSTLDYGKSAVINMLNATYKIDPNALAYLQYIYSLYGQWNEKSYKKLIVRNDLNAYQIAYLIRAIHQISKNEGHSVLKKEIPGLVQKLKSLKKADGYGTYFESSVERWSIYGGRIDSSAAVYMALTEIGDTSVLSNQLIQSMLKLSKEYGWSNTKETASALLSISKYLQKNKSKSIPKGTVQFYVDNVKIGEIKFDKQKEMSRKDLTLVIPMSKLKTKTEYTIKAVGPKSNDILFDVTMDGTLRLIDEKNIDMASKSNSIDALQKGLVIEKTYYKVKRIRDMNNQEYMVPEKFIGKHNIKVGDEIMVKLRFKGDADYDYLMIEDFLPSGFEVSKLNAYENSGLYSYAEKRDEKVVYFINSISKNKVQEVAYILRAELPGKFFVRPTRIETMYDPETQSWSAPAVFHVNK